MTNKNLEQRMAQSFIDMFPKFIPDENAPVGISEQKEFYMIMKNLYQLAFANPLLFVPSLNNDDAYPNRFHKSSYGKPELLVKMKKFLKTMEALLQNMYLLGKDSSIKINKREQNILSEIGIKDYSKLPAGWKWMSSRPESTLIDFSHCLFDKSYSYTSDIYASLLGEPAFRKLEKWMMGQGYKRHNIYNLIGSDCKLSLTYANPLWSKEIPRGGFEYKIKHTGISARYDPYIQTPAVFGLCIPNGLKPYLNAFDSMNSNVQRFIVAQTKKCNECKYCIQTDKTGTRQLAYSLINYEKRDYKLCQYFPGYNYCWVTINNDLADILIEVLTFMDKFIPDKKIKR